MPSKTSAPPTSPSFAQDRQLGHNQGVADPDRGQGLSQAMALTVGAGQALVDVDPVLIDAKLDQGSMR